MDIVECPYMPKGFILLDDGANHYALNTETGIAIKIPKFKMDFDFPMEYRNSGDRVIGTIKMKCTPQE